MQFTEKEEILRWWLKKEKPTQSLQNCQVGSGRVSDGRREEIYRMVVGSGRLATGILAQASSKASLSPVGQIDLPGIRRLNRDEILGRANTRHTQHMIIQKLMYKFRNQNTKESPI